MFSLLREGELLNPSDPLRLTFWNCGELTRFLTAISSCAICCCLGFTGALGCVFTTGGWGWTLGWGGTGWGLVWGWGAACTGGCGWGLGWGGCAGRGLGAACGSGACAGVRMVGWEGRTEGAWDWAVGGREGVCCTTAGGLETTLAGGRGCNWGGLESLCSCGTALTGGGGGRLDTGGGSVALLCGTAFTGGGGAVPALRRVCNAR